MLPADEVVQHLSSRGLEGVSIIQDPPHDKAFRDQSTVLVCPTRGMIDSDVVDSWLLMSYPMNHKRYGPIMARGWKVDDAYNAVIQRILDDPIVSTWKYVMTVEDDNIIPSDAHLRLLETMESGPWDVVSGWYRLKDGSNTPMVYGDPASGRFDDFTYRDISKIPRETRAIEVTAVPMGCALWKMSLFKELPKPWFMNLEEHILVNDQIKKRSEVEVTDPSALYVVNATQDVFFSIRARMKGKRLACDLRVVAGHKDPISGKIF